MADTTKRTKRSKDAGSDEDAVGFTDVEREAMRERVREAKASRGKASAADGEAEVQAKIAEMAEPDRSVAARIHALVLGAAPSLTPRTWYGMPAYALDGKVICFFQAATKFKVRYATFGFQPDALLDDGPMWATTFAVTELTPAVEARISDLVRTATAPR